MCIRDRVCELCVELIRQFYTEPRTFRITGERGGDDFTTYASGGIQEQRLPEYGMESARKPVFDLKIKSQKSSPFSRIAQNETAKELYGMGIFQPANADQALMVLDMMDFEGKAQVVEKAVSYTHIDVYKRQIETICFEVQVGLAGVLVPGKGSVERRDLEDRE